MLPGAAPREIGPDLTSLTREAVRAAEGVLQDATRSVRSRVAKDDKTVDRLLDREQRATHALAWLATYVEAVRQLFSEAGERQVADVKNAMVTGIGVIPYARNWGVSNVMILEN